MTHLRRFSIQYHAMKKGLRKDFLSSTALTTTQVTINTSAGSLLVPVTGSLTFNGREAKILVTDYIFGQNQIRVLYSTAEYVNPSACLSCIH